MRKKKGILNSVKKPLVVLVGALCCSAYAHAEPRNFVDQVTLLGGTSTDWHDATNWDSGLPTSSGVVMIRDGATVDITQPTGLVKQFYSNDATLNVTAGGVLLVDKTSSLGYEANTKTTVLVSGAGATISSNGSTGSGW